MVSFPNGKINLGLRVTGKRSDGFHNIETVFYPIAVRDAVEIIPSYKLSFASGGLTVDGPAENNLCLKAYKLLKADYPSLPEVDIFLYKHIPVGAGLGGGSADAVACLQLLNKIGELGLSADQLSVYALQLGSDCPFFLVNKPSLATGRGDELQEITFTISAYDLLIVNPGIHINTGWAFNSLQSFSPPGNLSDIVSRPASHWKDLLHNDFELPVFATHPEIGAIKESMYAHGAVYASMSGTGSTVYGLFEKNDKPDLQLPESYFVKWL